jgi:NADPH:quinone reductase
LLRALGILEDAEPPGDTRHRGRGRHPECRGGRRGSAPGQRVGYVTPGYGGYAESRILPAAQAILLPDELEDAAAASILLKGLTVCMLVRKVHAIQKGDAVLVHAAAGGVGQLLCGWAKHLGATVIGTVGSAEKVEIARRSGAEHVILYRERDVAAEVSAITKGEGVAAAYDAVGRDTFSGSLASLGYFGKLVSYGQASGPVEPFALALLAARSNEVARPILFHCLRNRGDLEAMAAETFGAVAAGVIKPSVFAKLPLPMRPRPTAFWKEEARRAPSSLRRTRRQPDED